MDGLLVIKSTTVCGSWISSQPLKEFEQQQVKSSAVFFFFSGDLRHFWGCFIASLSSGPYQTWFSRPVSCQLMTFSNNGLVARARPFPFPWQLQRQLDIGYKHWKRSALWNIMSLACKTKPTVCKFRCSPLRTSKNGWYKGHKILKVFL